MKIHIVTAIAGVFAWAAASMSVLAELPPPTSEFTPIVDPDGTVLGGYSGSFALLIGVSDYSGGWPDLDSIPAELDSLQATLSRQGFRVTRLMNPDSVALSSGMRDFIVEHGLDPNHRLLIYFSGHGHTRLDGRKGYLVPADAADPTRDETAFLRKALSMEQVMAWARQIEAKHALFLFDSCFSGAIFSAKSLGALPTAISKLTTEPVRQFITAGSAGEQVPAKSVFTPAVVDALEHGLADLNHDGFVTGTELGAYLQKEVPQHARQTPQFGKIQDYDLSRGDFVLLAGGRFEQQLEQNDSPFAQLQLRTEPSGAEVLVNDANGERGIAPMTVKNIPAGKVHIQVRHPGYRDYENTIVLQAGSVTKLTVILEPVTAAVEITSEPSGADWYIDGALAGRTPDQIRKLSVGRHTVVVKKNGFEEWEQKIDYRQGQRLALNAALQPLRQNYRLTIAAEPGNARVQIKNVRSPYQPGMRLRPGRYEVEITAPGFLPYREWVDIIDADKTVNIILQRKTQTIFQSGANIRDMLKDGSPAPEMVVIPAGHFWMGSRAKGDVLRMDEQPAHRVSITQPFAVSRYEITFDEFGRFATAQGLVLPDDGQFGRDDRPVINVTWEQADAYAQWLSKQTGARYSLLSEAQWEYVARAGDVGETTMPASAAGLANCIGCTDSLNVPGPLPVGSFGANDFGVFDMLGNVWEWVEDCYHLNYRDAPGNGSSWRAPGCSQHVLRGGGWNSLPPQLSVTERTAAGVPANAIGFRVAREL